MHKISKLPQPPIKLTQGSTVFSFLSTGDAFELLHGATLLNGFQGTSLYGSLNNIWLRLKKDTAQTTYPLLGVDSTSQLSVAENTLRYDGIIEDIKYTVDFSLANENTWFWAVTLAGSGQQVDLLYGQDLGLAGKNAVLTNELYGAQYIDYKVFENQAGFHVCARQNMSQNGANPYLQQGMVAGMATGFSTDGTQFFGANYKATHAPAALTEGLPSALLQGEFAYTGLQTEGMTLDTPQTVAFYGHAAAHLPTVTLGLADYPEIVAAFKGLVVPTAFTPVETPVKKDNFGTPYTSPTMGMAMLKEMFPQRTLEETEDQQLLSFFTPDHSHVVLQEKEVQVERAHGSIITTFYNTEKVDTNLITSTNYVYGLFHAQAVVGNTSYNKFLSANRGFYNTSKATGQRIYLELDGRYRLLTLPAVYEMGMNYSAWYYLLPNDDLLTVRAYATPDTTDLVLEAESKQGISYHFIITNQLVLGEQEYTQDILCSTLEDGSILRFSSAEKSEFYPDLAYEIQLPNTTFTTSDDRIFYTDNSPRNPSLLTISVKEKTAFQLIITGQLQGGESKIKPRYHFTPLKEIYIALYKNTLQDFSLHLEGNDDIAVLNETAWWYAHNAMVHYAAPHGLEQPGGAAWGTRDVCQGPLEFFLAFQNFSLARDILLTIFRHQQQETGEWSQWFMFDNFPYRDAGCHGDIVFWPLKIISEYILLSGDTSILHESVSYQQQDGSFSTETTAVLEHLHTAYHTITKRFLPETHLISYAGGDWNDTLQPANPALRENLVSTWTQALAYQALHQLGIALTEADTAFSTTLLATAARVNEDFQALLIQDQVVTGFVYKETDGSYRPMLHPNDKVTGIHYRMLPMTRSIIAEMAQPEQAQRNMDLIKEHLLCPDGARLMDNPPRYNGGVSELFERAEQAAYIGREISLMYTHAHIRYIEALAKLGWGDQAWAALFQINPVNLKEYVPTAEKRQRNLYFSSSEGAYTDRYDFSRNFSKLRRGDIPVKGGWRLYSSGPGIYLNQIITHVLGIQVTNKGLVIQPSLPKAVDGLQFTFTCFGKTIRFVYHITGAALSVSSPKSDVAYTTEDTAYGRTRLFVAKEDVLNAGNILHIYL